MEVVEEEGTVAGASGDRVVVLMGVERRKACEHCGLCFRRPDGSYQMEALSEVPVRPGDRVLLRVERPQPLTLTATVFLVPAVALVVGLLVGQHLTRGGPAGPWRDLVQGILGLGAAAAAFFGLHLYDRHLRSRRRRRPPRIVRVLQGAEETPQEEAAGS